MVTRRRIFVGVEREELPRVVGLVVGEPGKKVSFCFSTPDYGIQ